MLDGSVGGQAHRGVTTADAWEPVDLVAHDLVAAPSDALDGDGVLSQEREVAVLLGRLGGLAGREREQSYCESIHGRSLERDGAFAGRPHRARFVMSTCSHRERPQAIPYVQFTHTPDRLRREACAPTIEPTNSYALR